LALFGLLLGLVPKVSKLGIGGKSVSQKIPERAMGETLCDSFPPFFLGGLGAIDTPGASSKSGDTSTAL